VPHERGAEDLGVPPSPARSDTSVKLSFPPFLKRRLRVVVEKVVDEEVDAAVDVRSPQAANRPMVRLRPARWGV
jgi:hypothetical protein